MCLILLSNLIQPSYFPVTQVLMEIVNQITYAGISVPIFVYETWLWTDGNCKLKKYMLVLKFAA